MDKYLAHQYIDGSFSNVTVQNLISFSTQVPFIYTGPMKQFLIPRAKKLTLIKLEILCCDQCHHVDGAIDRRTKLPHSLEC